MPSHPRPRDRWVIDQVSDHWRRARRFDPLGGVHHTWCWPADLVVPSSPWLSWTNLDCCGGWNTLDRDGGMVDLDRLSLERVLAGCKPLGEAIWMTDEQGRPRNAWEAGQAEVYGRLALRALATPGLAVERRSDPWQPGTRRVLLRIGQDRRLGELFDLRAIGRAYTQGGSLVGRRVTDLADRPVMDCLPRDSRVESDIGLVACGLALGYPIESTLALIEGLDS